LWRAVKTVTTQSFAQRRKMLRKMLQPLFADPVGLLDRMGLKETARAEELSCDQFVALAKAYLSEKKGSL